MFFFGIFKHEASQNIYFVMCELKKFSFVNIFNKLENNHVCNLCEEIAIREEKHYFTPLVHK